MISYNDDCNVLYIYVMYDTIVLKSSPLLLILTLLGVFKKTPKQPLFGTLLVISVFSVHNNRLRLGV